MASDSARCRCTTTSWITAGSAPSASDARAMWLMPHVWLCLKRMTGELTEAASSVSNPPSASIGWNVATRPLYRAAGPVLAALLATARPAVAQNPAPPAAMAVGTTEWSLTAGAARGIALLQSSGGERYAVTHLTWGRVLTDLRGPGWVRGRFEWTVELAPLFAEWSSGRARGVGLSPLGWRWNLAPRGRAMPFAEVGGGALWTSAPIPDGTTGSNFTSYAGVGVRLLTRGASGLIAGYRLHHISNGNRLRRNPGVNAHMVSIGWTALDGR